MTLNRVIGRCWTRSKDAPRFFENCKAAKDVTTEVEHHYADNNGSISLEDSRAVITYESKAPGFAGGSLFPFSQDQFFNSCWQFAQWVNM
jgi:hypothetical protein